MRPARPTRSTARFICAGERQKETKENRENSEFARERWRRSTQTRTHSHTHTWSLKFIADKPLFYCYQLPLPYLNENRGLFKEKKGSSHCRFVRSSFLIFLLPFSLHLIRLVLITMYTINKQQETFEFRSLPFIKCLDISN